MDTSLLEERQIGKFVSDAIFCKDRYNLLCRDDLILRVPRVADFGSGRHSTVDSRKRFKRACRLDSFVRRQ